MSLETITQAIAARVGTNSGLQATLKFSLGSDGVIFLDGKTVPNEVTNEDRNADCTVKMAISDLEALINGKLDPMAAFSMGKLQIEGDLGVAMKLGSVVR